jgi:phosphoserine phosphatase
MRHVGERPAVGAESEHRMQKTPRRNLRPSMTLDHPPHADSPGNRATFALSPGLLVRGIAPPLRLSDYRLVAFDMDSTLISIECIDEIAAAVGRKAEVAAITEAAMRGEIADFAESLRRRLALLRGVPESALQRVYDERLAINPGVARFVNACRGAGLRTMLVSGGFTFFSDRVQQRLGLDRSQANVLEIVDGVLTGDLVAQPWGTIVDGAEKRRALIAECDAMGIAASQAIAVGDGANDLPMMRAAGLSIAFHAKPAVREQATVAITEGGMDRALELFADAG